MAVSTAYLSFSRASWSLHQHRAARASIENIKKASSQEEYPGHSTFNPTSDCSQRMELASLLSGRAIVRSMKGLICMYSYDNQEPKKAPRGTFV